jgi:hypothetical protein
MNRKFEWRTDFLEVFEKARNENKAVLLDFFNPG